MPGEKLTDCQTMYQCAEVMLRRSDAAASRATASTLFLSPAYAQAAALFHAADRLELILGVLRDIRDQGES